MAGLSGKNGTVSIGGTAKTKVTTWTFTPTTDVVETTGMSDGGDKTFEEGLRGGTISFSAHYDTAAGGAAVQLLTGKVAFILETDSTPQRTFTGTCIGTSAPVTVAVDGAVDYSFEGTVDGAWVES